MSVEPGWLFNIGNSINCIVYRNVIRDLNVAYVGCVALDFDVILCSSAGIQSRRWSLTLKSTTLSSLVLSMSPLILGETETEETLKASSPQLSDLFSDIVRNQTSFCISVFADVRIP